MWNEVSTKLLTFHLYPSRMLYNHQLINMLVMAIPIMEFQVLIYKISKNINCLCQRMIEFTENFSIFWNRMMAICQNMGSFDLQGLILKYFSQKHVLIRRSRLIFSHKVQLSLLVLFIFHITHVKKVYSTRMCPNFVDSPSFHLKRYPLKHFTYRQKSIRFCIP